MVESCASLMEYNEKRRMRYVVDEFRNKHARQYISGRASSSVLPFAQMLFPVFLLPISCYLVASSKPNFWVTLHVSDQFV